MEPHKRRKGTGRDKLPVGLDNKLISRTETGNQKF